MNVVKTAISLDKNLHAEAARMARKIKVSRSRLYAMALKEFIVRRENEELLRQLNESAHIEDSAEERAFKSHHRRSQRRMLEEGR